MSEGEGVRDAQLVKTKVFWWEWRWSVTGALIGEGKRYYGGRRYRWRCINNIGFTFITKKSFQIIPRRLNYDNKYICIWKWNTNSILVFIHTSCVKWPVLRSWIIMVCSKLSLHTIYRWLLWCISCDWLGLWIKPIYICCCSMNLLKNVLKICDAKIITPYIALETYIVIIYFCLGLMEFLWLLV
jgi:hypothetical protein